MRAPRWFWVVCAIWLVLFLGLIALPLGGTLRFAVDCAGWVVIGAALARESFRRARRTGAPEALGWRLAGSAGLSVAIVSVLDVVLTAVYGRIPLPPLAIAAMDDLTWLLLLAGVLTWTGRGHQAGAAMRAGLDAVLLAASFFLIAWWLALDELATGEGVGTFQTIRSAVPFALSSTGLGVVGFLAARSTERLKGPLGWFGVGYLMLLVGALGYAWVTMLGVFYPGHPYDGLFQLPLLAFAMAPASRRPLPQPIRTEDPGNDLGDLLTNFPAAVALSVAAGRSLFGLDADGVTKSLVIVIVATLLARQFIALRDVRSLSVTLEKRVADRSRALEESQRALVRSQRMEALGRMAGGIAHDFNNVLSAIAGHLELLRPAIRPGPESEESASAIEDATRSGSELARRLLTFSRPSGAAPRLVSSRDALQRAAQLARGLSRGTVRVETAVARDDLVVMMDPVLLDQVLANLASNAVDATPPGGTVTLEYNSVNLNNHTREIAEPAEGRYVKFAISDTGIGMDENTAARIFEPFFTTKAIGRRGTGLGLSTAYYIVTQAGGSISVQSRLGAGTRFEVLLREAESEAHGPTAPLVRETELPGTSERQRSPSAHA